MKFEIKLLLIFSISTCAVFGSLFFSEYLELAPCNLCWYQRIFIYPIPLLAMVAYKLKDKLFKYYSGLLSFIGVLFATYHIYIQSSAKKSMFCSISDEDCSTIQFELFGFITIPMLSLITFLLIFIISFFKETVKDISN